VAGSWVILQAGEVVDMMQFVSHILEASVLDPGNFEDEIVHTGWGLGTLEACIVLNLIYKFTWSVCESDSGQTVATDN